MSQVKKHQVETAKIFSTNPSQVQVQLIKKNLVWENLHKQS